MSMCIFHFVQLSSPDVWAEMAVPAIYHVIYVAWVTQFSSFHNTLVILGAVSVN